MSMVVVPGMGELHVFPRRGLRIMQNGTLWYLWSRFPSGLRVKVVPLRTDQDNLLVRENDIVHISMLKF